MSEEVLVSEEVVQANGLEHHVVRWGTGAPVILCHGFLDFAWSWDSVGRKLAELGYEAIAFDWRGHGETEWIGAGGYYHFPDYVRDLDELIPKLTSRPPFLVGHSMGGSACCLYAGVRSSKIRRLVIMEGLGPPEPGIQEFPARLSAWLDGLDRLQTASRSPIANLQEATKRMRVRNPRMPQELQEFLAEKATRPHPSGAGLSWRFDPRHRTTAPVPFNRGGFLEVLRSIQVPTLVVAAEDGFRLHDEEERRDHIAEHAFAEVSGASHMLHWEAPEQTANLLHSFFSKSG